MNAKLKNEFEIILKYLNISTDAYFSNCTVEDAKNVINEILNEIDSNGNIDKGKIEYLLAPTGCLQEISIDNGWGREFLTLAENIEKMVV
jgi:hypothetical protein